MCNYPDRAPRKGVFRDIHALYDLAETTDMPVPDVHGAARAVLDYRYLRQAGPAREAVACAVALLSAAFGVTFEPRTEVAPPPPLGDGTPRYLMEATLPGGMPLVVISLFEHVHVLDLDAAQAGERVAA